MSAAPNLFPATIASPLTMALAHFGFWFDGEGWQRGDLRFRQTGRWYVLEQTLDPADTEPNGDLGQPALWRTVTEGGRTRRIFELPDTAVALAGAGFSDPEEDPFMACLAWALMTAEGKVDRQSETTENLEILVPKSRLTVLAGVSVRQGEWIHDPQRLALRFPIVHVVPVNLSPLRLAQLHAVLRDAQNGWSLIRLGLTGPPTPSVIAEVDLTGAPAGALEALISTALDSLHNVISLVVESTEVLIDAEVASVALDSAAFQTSTTGSIR